jgi:hypothetical protein
MADSISATPVILSSHGSTSCPTVFLLLNSAFLILTSAPAIPPGAVRAGAG